MARVTVSRKYPDGDVIQVTVKVENSYPDSLDQARSAAQQAFLDAVGVVLTDVVNDGEATAPDA